MQNIQRYHDQALTFSHGYENISPRGGKVEDHGPTKSTLQQQRERGRRAWFEWRRRSYGKSTLLAHPLIEGVLRARFELELRIIRSYGKSTPLTDLPMCIRPWRDYLTRADLWDSAVMPVVVDRNTIPNALLTLSPETAGLPRPVFPGHPFSANHGVSEAVSMPSIATARRFRGIETSKQNYLGPGHLRPSKISKADKPPVISMGRAAIQSTSAPSFESSNLSGCNALHSWKNGAGRSKPWKTCTLARVQAAQAAQWRWKGAGASINIGDCALRAHSMPWLFVVSQGGPNHRPRHADRKTLKKKGSSRDVEVGDIIAESLGDFEELKYGCIHLAHYAKETAG